MSNPAALAALRPELHRFGITRVAQQTDLDTIGIPCWAAIRPNSRTLAVHQGKGADDIAAQLSAIMEAVEFDAAETPLADSRIASPQELLDEGHDWFLPTRSLPRDRPIDQRERITWLAGDCLASGKPVHVPLDSAAIAPNAVERLPFSQSSNGLGAGFSLEEAAVHGLCEVIERDASSLWAMGSLRRCASTAIAVDEIVDEPVQDCIGRIRSAGFDFRVFDLTTDVGMPVIMAFLWSGRTSDYFDVASGVCAHPSASRALIGALQEAAQTRISNIAGARDDIEPAEYARPLPAWISNLIALQHSDRRPLPPSLCDADFAGLPDRLGGRSIVVPLTPKGSSIQVVKVMAETMEDRSTNVHWRPGPRAIRAMTAL